MYEHNSILVICPVGELEVYGYGGDGFIGSIPSINNNEK